jgi:hypothetical protein
MICLVNSALLHTSLGLSSEVFSNSQAPLSSAFLASTSVPYPPEGGPCELRGVRSLSRESRRPRRVV